MKTIQKALRILMVMLFINGTVLGQQGNPPPQPPGHGSPGNEKPNELPLGSGLGILSLMVLFYVVKKSFFPEKNREDSS